VGISEAYIEVAGSYWQKLEEVSPARNVSGNCPNTVGVQHHSHHSWLKGRGQKHRAPFSFVRSVFIKKMSEDASGFMIFTR
jgi:hypothetical protein